MRKKRVLAVNVLVKEQQLTKKELARKLGISRQSLYYKPKKPEQDWMLKTKIENIFHTHPSYGYRRLAIALTVNTKRIRRVMNLYGLRPYRRRPKKYRKKRDEGRIATPYQNLLQVTPFPSKSNTVWVSDFTHIRFHCRWLYLATVMDLYTREIVGWYILNKHSVDLVEGALIQALTKRIPPTILHSDQGSEYASKRYTRFVQHHGIRVSMSKKSSPWENGYQESFYSQFKLDLGDTSRCEHMGELIVAIHNAIYSYNNTRIHTALKMPPAVYAMRQYQNQERSVRSSDYVS